MEKLLICLSLSLIAGLVASRAAKFSLSAAGEITPEGRTSARTINQAEPPLSVE